MADKLAIDGGTPASGKPFPMWPQFDPKCFDAVAAILKSGKVNYWTGPIGMQFEQALADWCGAKFGISTATAPARCTPRSSGLGHRARATR